ncbi:MAG: Glycosyl transferase group 1 [candidate division TM6 bacterium GW2011_GWF2_37_49]|nr:MAG: Glycosyl transferase group 1 [candidate division TM6 bacterium GW2011_GWF2_37_49]
MKVLIVSLWPINKSSIGGTEKYVIDLATMLKRRSVDCNVLMLSGKKNIIDGVKYQPLILSSTKRLDEYSIKNEFFSDLTPDTLKKFAKEVESNFDFTDYDVIHFNSLLFFYCASRKKRVFTIHENPFEFDQYWGENSFALISNIIEKEDNRNTVFIAPSEYYSKTYERFTRKKVLTIPHSFCPFKPAKILNDTKNSHDTIDILVPARLEIEQKGQDYLLHSLHSVQNSLAPFKIIFTGVDDQYQKNVEILKSLAEGYSISVKFLKLKMNEMRNAFLSADLTVLPSRSESFGYSALESLALGKKTVLSDIPTFKEIAKGNPLAYLGHAHNQILFGETIKKAIAAKKVETNSEWIKRYSPDLWVSQYIDCYEQF